MTTQIWLPFTQRGPVAQRIRHLTTNQGIAGSSPARVIFLLTAMATGVKKVAPPGGLEPPTFRLTAERASRLRHGGQLGTNLKYQRARVRDPTTALGMHILAGVKKNRRGWDSNPRGQSPLD